MTSALTVSLKAAPLPYGILALATLANVPVTYLDAATPDLLLAQDGKEITEANAIAIALAGLITSSGETSKVLEPLPLVDLASIKYNYMTVPRISYDRCGATLDHRVQGSRDNLRCIG